MVAVLILLATCLFGLTLTAVVFAIPVQSREDEALAEASARPAVAYGHFFLDEAAAAGSALGRPQDALLRQLEEHVRREHQAAEAFLQVPSAESLHAPNETPLWN